MAKKGQAIQLQTEVNNDEDWEKLLQREGLIVVDVYSEWCGPCTGMTATLKKLKLEIGGDVLQLAIAKADKIEALARFRNKSEPTWMFIVNGKMANFMFGANAPKLTRLIIEELKKETDARMGRRERIMLEIHDLADEEKERLQLQEVLTRAAREKEKAKAEKELYERRTAEAHKILETLNHLCPMLIFPHARTAYQEAFGDLFGEAGLTISSTDKVDIKEEVLNELFYFGEMPFPEESIEELLNDTSLICNVKPLSMREEIDVDNTVLKIVYGPMAKPPGSPDSPARILAKIPWVHPQHIELELEPEPEREVSRHEENEEHHRRLSRNEDNLSKNKNVGKQESVGRNQSAAKQNVVKNQSVTKNVSSTKQESLAKTEPSHTKHQAAKHAEAPEIIGVWVPENSLIKATALRLFFHKMTETYLIAEPEPIPPHYAVVFEANRRAEISEVMEKYPQDIVRYGFFTHEVPETAQLLAKTIQKYEKVKDKTPDQRLVIELSKKRSECVLAFAQLKPTYISPSVDEGKRECALFFPDDYDVAVEEEEEEKPPPKKKAKAKRAEEEGAEEAIEEGVEEAEEGEAPLGEEGAPGEEPAEGAEDASVPEGAEGPPAEGEVQSPEGEVPLSEEGAPSRQSEAKVSPEVAVETATEASVEAPPESGTEAPTDGERTAQASSEAFGDAPAETAAEAPSDAPATEGSVEVSAEASAEPPVEAPTETSAEPAAESSPEETPA